MTRGWNKKHHSFTQFYGSEDLEATQNAMVFRYSGLAFSWKAITLIL
jgi:hypothetical protein